MDSIGIYTQANDLVRSIGTRDPEQIVRDMGIMLLLLPQPLLYFSIAPPLRIYNIFIYIFSYG